MPVSETRLAVNLADGASAGLQRLNNTYGRFANTIQKSGNQLAQFNKQMNSANFGGLASKADNAANSLSNMNKTMERLVYSASRYFVIYKALGAVGNVWDTLVGGSYEYAKSLETNQIGIAGILKSMITLNGEQLQWNQAMAMSSKAMKGLQSEALRTAATSKELIETFRALLGPGLSSGMSIDQIVSLSTVGTNAVRSLGLPTNQYVQELRSIITEGIRPASSTLATSLGITNKDIKAAKQSAEGLYNYLMKRMQGFSDAVKYTSGTVEGRIARIQEGLQVAGAKGADTLYKSWSNVLEKIADYLIPVPEKLADEWKVNPEFVTSVENIAKTVGKIAEGFGDIGQKVAPLIGGAGGAGLSVIGQLADKMELIFGYIAARKLAPFIADIGNMVVRSREAYEAQTGLGRAIQGVNDKITGRTLALRNLAQEQQKTIEQQSIYASGLTKINSLIAQQKALENELASMSRINKTVAGWKQNSGDMWKAAEIGNLRSELRMLGVETERVNAITKQFFSYLKKGSQEGAEALRRLIVEEERETRVKAEAVAMNQKWGETAKANAERASILASQFGSVTFAAGIMCDLLGQADEKNKEWWESAGNAALQAGMFAMAIGSIASAIPGMIDGLARGIEWLNKFATARAMAGFGIAGGIALGVGAVIKHAYNKYNETGIASAIDEWTGEEVSHDFGHQFGNPQEMRDIDDADSYAIINTPDVGTVGLLNPPSGGGGGGGRGGRSSINKAEESAARMKKIIEDLNKEITNMNGQATAYEKAMAAAKDKIAGYEKDIVKAIQNGVDVTEVRKKQEEYLLAAKKKALELQEDENLKYMKLEEEQANRINVLGQGTLEYQREVLAERLQAHKEYLEELLAAEIDNKERRYQLEAELANVTKQLNDTTVYNFKSGWTQALEEIANQQTNFKDATTSLFGSLENSLVDLVSSTDSASNKFKRFCQEVTNTILKSMAQIIIRGLITRAIMAAIGLGGGGGGGVISDGSLLGSIKDSPYASLAGGFIGYTGAKASGGNVKAGGTYLVGEQGPELVRFGSSGRVYSNAETRGMLGAPQNVKIELINESGTELKTENANVKFDVDSMIISTVIKGVSNNTMGMRTMLKGLATT